MLSPPCHNRSLRPEGISKEVIALPPPAISVSSILAGEIHAMELTDDLRFGVLFTAWPPAEAIVKTSPPVKPSSLINPWMKPIDDPSGDQRGIAICVSGR